MQSDFAACSAVPEWQAMSREWRSRELAGPARLRGLFTDNPCGDTPLQRLLGQRMKAFSLSLCRQRKLFMELGWNPEVEFTGKLFSRLNTFLLADLHKDVERFFEFLSKLLRIGAVEISTTTQTENFSTKEISL